MFDSKIYRERRKRLQKKIDHGLILFLGNEESPMNYPDNAYRFRQDSNFLYFFGLDSPGLAGIIDVDEDKEILFGDDVDVEDIIWMGEKPFLKDRAAKVGVTHVSPRAQLADVLTRALEKNRKFHFLPVYREQTSLQIQNLLNIEAAKVNDCISKSLIKAVVDLRSKKSKPEVEQIEEALKITYQMHTTAMKMAIPGKYEREIAGAIEGIALSYGANISFPIILTVNGQILHNHYHGNKLRQGQLMVNDSGAESVMHYAADITRTIPVGGKFTSKQGEIYEIVLNAQETAIQASIPGRKNKDVHIKAVKVIASGLKELGIMKGDVDEAVKAGAHALFMPHGLGHMMGLDVHDMEGLGEDHVGYDKKTERSDQFGLAYLRMAKELKPGYVLTVEPGIYFIPALIDKWFKENKLTEYIDYQKLDQYRDFGGIRIEDDILITEKGQRILGKPIPKTIAQVEAITAKG
ncbi:MAG: M24 family metallopeptidase [Candidatus Aminicenantes bacterium]|nr:M24 family metallopeptidase [Candidatus Aminicenantes bacterium]